MFASSRDIRYQIEGRRQPVSFALPQHPEILEMIIDIANRRIEDHVTKQCRDIGSWRG
jgi:hypothetical protein